MRQVSYNAVGRMRILPLRARAEGQLAPRRQNDRSCGDRMSCVRTFNSNGVAYIDRRGICLDGLLFLHAHQQELNFVMALQSPLQVPHKESWLQLH